ncbi:MAG: tetratricopeptide repeat protein, partial [Saprospiraceae bacterium]|nr:tetratricopeptide repeat protein [Saprospiraceae bacterium]
MLNVKQILLLVVAFTFVAIDAAFSQSNVKIDSLTALLNKYPKEDTVKARRLIELSETTLDVNANESLVYSDKALAIVANFKVHDIKADALRAKAECLTRFEKYTEALDLTLKALEIYEQLRSTPKIARAHNLLGLIYSRKSDYDKATKQFERSMTLSEQIKNVQTKMESLNGMGSVYSQLSNYKKAIVYYEQALDLAQRFNDPKTEAISLGYLGIAYFNRKNHTQSIEYLQKAVIINESINNRYFLSSNYSSLGDSYKIFNDDNKALSFYNKGLNIATGTGNKSSEAALIQRIGTILGKLEFAVTYLEKIASDNEKAARFEAAMDNYFSLGRLHNFWSNPTKAIEYFNKALTIAIKTENKHKEAKFYAEIGFDYEKLANYTQSIEYLQKALMLNESVKDYNITRIVCTAFYSAYLALTDYDKALFYCNKALMQAKQIDDKDWEASIYQKVGSCHTMQKKYDEALVSLKKGVEIYKILGDIDGSSTNSQNLGNVYYLTGRNLDAHRYYQEALTGFKKSPQDQKHNIAGLLNNIARLYIEESDSLVQQMGVSPNERYAKATALITESIEISTEIGAKSRVVKSLFILSTIHEKNKDFIKAYDTFKRYIDIRDSVRGDEVQKQITRKEIQYEFDKKETELKYQQQLTAGELEKQRLLTAQREQDLLLNRQNLTLKEQALALSNREKDLAHLAYLKEQAEKQEKAQQLSLSEEREKGKERDLSLKNLELSAQQKQNLYLGLLAAVLLGGLGTLFYFYNTLKKQKNIIAQQNELNEHTIAILSHDIKEPLLGVKLMLKKLNKDDPFVAQASQSLEGQINSVNGILTNLLKMKKLSLTKKDKNAQADVQAVVKNVLQELNVAIQTKELTVENELTEGVLLPIAPEKLQIIVHNLLSNAVKYSFPNQKIRIFNEGKGFCIQDFGVGLSPEQRSKLMREVTASQRGT